MTQTTAMDGSRASTPPRPIGEIQPPNPEPGSGRGGRELPVWSSEQGNGFKHRIIWRFHEKGRPMLRLTTVQAGCPDKVEETVLTSSPWTRSGN